MTSCLPTLTMKPFQNKVPSERKEFAPIGANSFLHECTAMKKGDGEGGAEMKMAELLPLTRPVIGKG